MATRAIQGCQSRGVGGAAPVAPSEGGAGHAPRGEEPGNAVLGRLHVSVGHLPLLPCNIDTRVKHTHTCSTHTHTRTRVAEGGLTQHQQGLLGGLADLLLVGPANVDQLLDALLSLEETRINKSRDDGQSGSPSQTLAAVPSERLAPYTHTPWCPRRPAPAAPDS